jgi:FAD-dependent oxidoreductase domain-containing protein 1
MAVDGQPADIGFRKGGYLFIVPPAGRAVLQRNLQTQRTLGCNVSWLDPAELKQKFPSMNVEDLGAAVHSPDDGWLDPHSVLTGFRDKAKSLGADFVADEVTGLNRSGNAVTAAQLRSGQQIEAAHFVNAAGPWAGEVCAMLGIDVPIEPLRRFEHFFECQDPIEPLPYIKDTRRLAFRPEGTGYSGGVPTLAEPRLQLRRRQRLLREGCVAGASPPVPAVRADPLRPHAGLRDTCARAGNHLMVSGCRGIGGWSGRHRVHGETLSTTAA